MLLSKETKALLEGPRKGLPERSNRVEVHLLSETRKEISLWPSNKGEAESDKNITSNARVIIRRRGKVQRNSGPRGTTTSYLVEFPFLLEELTARGMCFRMTLL
jgi:hypothetical protein